MGFGIKLAPGIRLSTTNRGLRLGLGPHKARIHIGGGYRPSVSTGYKGVTV